MKYRIDPAQLTLVTGPTYEPVSLADMKAHLRVDFSDDDELIAAQIIEARAWMEKALNLTLVQQTFDAVLPCFFSTIEFPAAPLTSVVSIKYWNDDSPSTQTTLATTEESPIVSSGLYRVDLTRAQIYLADGQVWPTAVPRHDAVTIRVTLGPAPAGSPLSADTPAPLKAALKLLVGDMYENRESSTQLHMEELPTAKRLMQVYRNY